MIFALDPEIDMSSFSQKPVHNFLAKKAMLPRLFSKTQGLKGDHFSATKKNRAVELSLTPSLLHKN
jgi:hypothetical protein